MKKISSQIIEIRKELGLSQEDFAKEIGFSKSYVGDIESGRTGPSLNIVLAIRDRFKIPIDKILSGDDIEEYVRAQISPELTVLLNILRMLDQDGLKDIFALAVSKAKRMKGPEAERLKESIYFLEKKLE